MEDLADEQRGFYREIGIFLRPATGTGLGRVPCGECLFGEPDRDIATLAQGFVIFGPVGHVVTRFLDLVTYIPQVEDTIWREFRCQSGGRNAHLARRVAEQLTLQIRDWCETASTGLEYS